MGSKAKQCSIHPRHNRFCIQHHEDLKLSAASTSLKSRTFDITRLSKAGTFVMNRWSRDICFVRVMTSGWAQVTPDGGKIPRDFAKNNYFSAQQRKI